MSNFTIATIFMVMANVLMWFVGLAVLAINPTGSLCYSLDGTIIGSTITHDLGTNLSIVDNDVIADLPAAEGTISTGSTSIFTDIFNNILSWAKSTPGIKYVYGVVAAPYNILKCTGLPNEFIAGIGTLWYLVSLIVMLAFFWGR